MKLQRQEVREERATQGNSCRHCGLLVQYANSIHYRTMRSRCWHYVSAAHDILAVYANQTATLDTLHAILTVPDLHRHASYTMSRRYSA